MDINELSLLEDEKLREKMIERIEVLDKVKQLITLPNTDFATVEQVADYYDVKEKTIQVLVDRNKKELEDNGYSTYKQSELLPMFERNPQVVETVNTQWYKQVIFKDGSKLKINNAGLRLFSRRSILNVGMLLRDSEVAKEVRTYLLNIEEASTEEQKEIIIDQLNEEDKIALRVINAKDKMEIALIMNEYKRFKDEQIEKRDIKIDALTDGILRWDNKSAINKMIRKIAAKTFKSYGKFMYVKAWEKLRSEMLYKHNIHITKRIDNSNIKKATIFDVLDEDELTLAVQSCVALCEMYKIDISDILYEEQE